MKKVSSSSYGASFGVRLFYWSLKKEKAWQGGVKLFLVLDVLY